MYFTWVFPSHATSCAFCSNTVQTEILSILHHCIYQRAYKLTLFSNKSIQTWWFSASPMNYFTQFKVCITGWVKQALWRCHVAFWVNLTAFLINIRIFTNQTISWLVTKTISRLIYNRIIRHSPINKYKVYTISHSGHVSVLGILNFNTSSTLFRFCL